MRLLRAWFAISFVLSGTLAAAADWPQFRGPRRDNISDETGLLKQWPEGGPKLLWRAEGLGHGFAGAAIAQGRIFTAGNLGEETVVTALDLQGKRLWQTPNGPAYEKQYPGSRSTPTVDGGRVYHLAPEGDLICLDAQTGQRAWGFNLKKFGGRVSTWGLAESPLVDGERLIVCPAGPEIAMVALDKRTGATLWECRGAGDKPAYASAILVDYQGLRQLVTMTATSAIGVAADTGKLLWRREWKPPFDVNAATPVYHDGAVAISTTWGRGASRLRLVVDGQSCRAEESWHTAAFDNEHGGFLLFDGHLYGLADGNHSKRQWACIEWSTGRTAWLAPGPPGRTASLTAADGMLYLAGEEGDIALQRRNPQRLEIVSRFKLPKGGEGPLWAHPVVCGGRLYLRHGEFLYAYDVRDPSRSCLWSIR
jgi:outer membrane protein assembly factor BamB